MELTRQQIFRRDMHAAHNAILAKLVELCPATFAPRGQSCWPLKIKIHEDIAALLPDASPRDIALFLGVYTKQRRYHRSLKEGASRLDLSGQPAGEVNASEAAHALKMIARSDAKAARPIKKAAAPTPPKLVPALVEVKKPEAAPELPAKAKTPQAPAKAAKARPAVVVVVKKRTIPKATAPMRKTA